MFVDERAGQEQREALQTIWGGQAGGWPGDFTAMIGNMRGMEFARIDFEIDDDLGSWRVEIPGKLLGEVDALSGPTTPREGARVQVHNPPGAESDRVRSRPGGEPRWTARTHSTSAGSGAVSRASTFPSTGRAHSHSIGLPFPVTTTPFAE